MQTLPYDPAEVTAILAGLTAPVDSPEALPADQPSLIRLQWVKPGWGWITEHVTHVRYGDFDVALAAVAGIVGGIVVERNMRPLVEISPKRWTQEEVLARLDAAGTPIAGSTWRAYVARGEAPKPVDARPNRWSEAHIEAWIRERPGKGGRPARVKS